MASDDIDEVIGRELALLSPELRRSPGALEEILDPEFSEIGASGRLFTRASIMRALAEENPAETGDVEVTEMDAKVLADGLVLVTYLARNHARAARRSSLWRFSEGAWRIVFHQGTTL